jgi:phosphoribosylformimino-5-aminoimidazole carboxamide ribotide isomerase
MIRLIPAIDIIDGKCVRLAQGDYGKKTVYGDDPLDMAQRFEQHGLRYLHLVDLDGAREKRVVNYRIVEKICAKTSLIVDFGGGIASDQDLRIALECGVHAVNVGSVAVKDKSLAERWLAHVGSERFILSADTKGEKIVVSGWQEGTETWIYDLIAHYQERGLTRVACTDVERDGMLSGSAHDLYKRILDKFPTLEIIASGGVSSITELETLSALGVKGAIVGRAIYEGRISLGDLKRFVEGT